MQSIMQSHISLQLNRVSCNNTQQTLEQETKKPEQKLIKSCVRYVTVVRVTLTVK